MLRLAICDDDGTDLAKTSEIIKEWRCQENHPDIRIHTFRSPYNLIDSVSGGDTYDVFLLDILMPDMTGISLGEHLSNILGEPLIVYLSSSRDYYPDAFRLYAFNYICKPVRRDNLFPVLDKIARNYGKKKNEVFVLKTSKGFRQIPLHQIVYAELLSHVCYLHLADGQCLKSLYLRSGFDQFLAPVLEHANFIKTHTSFAVNLDYSERLTVGSLELTTKDTVPVARSFSAKVQKLYIDYWLQEIKEP